MKSFYMITLGYLLCMVSQLSIAQNIHKAPEIKQDLNTRAHFDRIDKSVANQYTLNYASLKKEQHFDIFYPAYDSLDYDLTQGIFWRIHEDFEPEEYIYFDTPDGEADSINIKFKNAVVAYNWLNDSFNEDSVTVAFEDAGPITVDTIFYFYGHANRSGMTNTLRTRIMPVNEETGQPILNATALWEDVVVTDTSLTAPNDNPDSIFLDLRVLPVNFTLPENKPFAVLVEFSGGNKIEDEFNLLATFNQPCGNTRVAQQSKFYANSYYEISALVGGVGIEQFFPLADLGGLGFDFDNDMVVGESEECENFYIQNWHIGATVTFDVALKAQITASADTICKNGAVDLTGIGLFGEPPYSYNWSPTDGLTQTTAGNTTAAPIETTTYTLTVKDATDSETKLSYTIYVNDLTVNLGDDVMVDCGSPHQSIPEVTNSFGNEISYQWNHGQTSSVTPLFPGNYQLTVKDGNCEASDDIVVGLSNSDLIVDFNADNIFNAVVSFENLSENANFYAWNFGDGNTASDQSPQHAYLSGGTYQVSLNASSGNCSYTKYTTIQVGTASSVYYIEQINNIKVGPNPVSNQINFTIHPSYVKNDFEMMLYNMKGVLVQRHQFAKNNTQGSMAISDLSNGIYFVSFKIGFNSYQQKIIVIP